MEPGGLDSGLGPALSLWTSPSLPLGSAFSLLPSEVPRSDIFPLSVLICAVRFFLKAHLSLSCSMTSPVPFVVA